MIDSQSQLSWYELGQPTFPVSGHVTVGVALDAGTWGFSFDSVVVRVD